MNTNELLFIGLVKSGDHKMIIDLSHFITNLMESRQSEPNSVHPHRVFINVSSTKYVVFQLLHFCIFVLESTQLHLHL
jgi:hypothetical protein